MTLKDKQQDAAVCIVSDTGYQAREELRQWAVRHTGCDIQEGIDGKGWPCGTCFTPLLDEIGLDYDAPEYHEHNTPVDRANEVWRAILQIRDAGKK